MPEFQCASPVCTTRLSAPTTEDLMHKMEQHVRTVHRIPRPTKSIMDYLAATAVSHTTSSDAEAVRS